LKISPFDTFYGRKCNNPINWDNPEDRVVLGPIFLKDMEGRMVKIKKNLKETQDRKYSYADKNKISREFKVGEHLILKVNRKKISLKLASCTKPVAIFCGPFEILNRIGTIAYMLALLVSMNVHNLFHVSLLKKYVHDPNHDIDWNLIQVELEGDFQVQLVRVLDKKNQNSLELTHRNGKSLGDLLRS
jgi:hypothetical protein